MASDAATQGFSVLTPGRVSYSKRQTEILDALEGIFLSRGFRSLTLSDLTGAVRCSRSTLYEIAPTKEELFLLVLERMLRRVDAEGRAAAEKLGDPVERIEACLLANVAVLNQTSPAFTDDTVNYLPALRILNDHATRGMQWAGQIIDEGIRSGRFRNVDSRLAAEILSSAAQRISVVGLTTNSGMPWTEAVRAAIELILYGLVGRDKQ